MILFLNDWDEYPTAYPHLETSNTSFMRYAALLKSMGIKNHLFALTLIDQDLKYVNPRDPNLEDELKIKIVKEVKNNPWYYFREIARVPMESETVEIKFRANRGNMTAYWLFFNHITFLLEQIRQTGKSFSIDVLMSVLLNVCATDTRINLLTKDDTLRSTNLIRLKDIIEDMPEYLNMRVKGDIANTEEIRVSRLRNSYKGHLPNRSPKLALNVGRGLTGEVYHLDEVVFCANISITLPAMLAGGSAARDIAIMRGTPYGTIMTTTAGKKDDRDGKYIYKLRQNSAVWTERFLDAKNIDELRDMIKAASPEGEVRVSCAFNHRQLGYTDEWLEATKAEVNATGDDARRDFHGEWTSGGISSPFTVKIAESLRAGQREMSDVIIDPNTGYSTRIYLPRNDFITTLQSVSCVIGIDGSEALGRDDIGMTITRIDEAVPIGVGTFNTTNLTTYAKWLSDFMIRFPKTVLIIERRSSGVAITDYVIDILVSKGIDPFRRIYNKIVNEAHINRDNVREITRPIVGKDVNYFAKIKRDFGFATSATGSNSRNALYGNIMSRALEYFSDKLKDRVLIDQILALTIKNGRIDHEDGMHDDLVVSWLLTMWFIFEARNKEFYGISPREVLSKVRIESEGVSQAEVEFREKRNEEAIRAIEKYVSEIRRCRDKTLVSEYRRRIEQIKSRHELDQKVVDDIDSFFRSLK